MITLSKHQLLQLIENSRLDSRGRNVIGNCPVCGKDEFGVSLGEGNPFNCYRKKKCGVTGNVFSLLKLLGREDLIKKGTEYREVDILSPLKPSLFITDQSTDNKIQPVNLPIGWKRIYSDDYLQTRGFTPEDFEKWEVGTTRLISKLRNYLIFPVKMHGEIVGWVGRCKIPCEKKDRYRNSKTNFSHLLYNFNENNLSSKVVLCEGIFDTINSQKALDMTVLGTFKGSLSDNQINILKREGVKEVIIFYDRDILFKELKKEKYLHLPFKTKVAIIDDKQKDPGELSAQEIQKNIQNSIDIFEFIFNFIE